MKFNHNLRERHNFWFIFIAATAMTTTWSFRMRRYILTEEVKTQDVVWYGLIIPIIGKFGYVWQIEFK